MNCFYHCFLQFILLPICSIFILPWFSFLKHLVFCDSTSCTTTLMCSTFTFTIIILTSTIIFPFDFDAFLEHLLHLCKLIGMVSHLMPIWTTDVVGIRVILLTLLRLISSSITIIVGSSFFLTLYISTLWCLVHSLCNVC